MCTVIRYHKNQPNSKGKSRGGVEANVLDCDIVVSEFEF